MAIDKVAYVQLARFRAAIRSFLHFSEERARAAGLTPQQHQMLLAIKGQPERDWATPGEIATFLQVGHNAAVGLITRAETAGLVQRGPHPDDGRKVAVSLTQQGEGLLAELSADHRRELERLAPTIHSLVTMLGDGR
jgi:DNA-binding MarR family transcriptional regulator